MHTNIEYDYFYEITDVDYIVLTVQLAYILYRANSNIYIFNKFIQSRFYVIDIDVGMLSTLLKYSSLYLIDLIFI